MEIWTTINITDTVKVLGQVSAVFDAPVAQRAIVTVRPPATSEFVRIFHAIAVVVAIWAPIIIFIAVPIFRLIRAVILSVGDTIEIAIPR